MASYKERLKNIKAFLFDVDGVLTDGRLYLTSDGTMMRSMNTQDGYVMAEALKLGYIIGIITGGNDPMVKNRLQALGIRDIYTQSADKLEDYEDFLLVNDLKDEEVLYMGDDTPDIPVMERVHVSSCPKNATRDVLSMADYVSHKNGGEACVRDVVEQVLRVQGNWS